MIETNDKAKQIAYSLLQDIDFSCYTKDFLRSIMAFLELDETKPCQKSIIAEKIAQVYEVYRGQYDIHLTQPKFKILNPQAKDFLWTLFKQFDERWNQRKMIPQLQSKPMIMRDHMNSHYITPNQNMNMNMVNMFMDVPNLQSIEEIEIFQRKMFQIYKNFMPQVINSLPMSTGQYYRAQNSYHPYSMSNIGSLNNLGSMSNISPMPGMNMGMNGFTAMNGRNSMNGMGHMGGMFTQKQHNDFYEPGPSYSNRYFYDNKMGNGYNSQTHNMQIGEKNMMNDFRPVSSSQNQIPSMGFSYYGQRPQQQDAKAGFKSVNLSYSQNKILGQQVERKQVYSQKYLGGQDIRYDNHFFSQSANQYSIGVQKNPPFKNREKQRQFPNYSNPQEAYMGQQPRKMTKKDDQVSIFNEEHEDKQSKPEINLFVCKETNDPNNCFHCKIIQLDPLNEVEQILKLEAVAPQINEIKLTITKKTLQKISKNPDRLDIQLRCMKMDKQLQNSITWPEKARLSVDEEIIEQISQSQGSKKRKDKPFIFSKYFGNEKNSQETVQILLQVPKSSDKSTRYNYLFGVFVVIKHSVKEMLDIILKNIPQLNITSFFKSKKPSKTDSNQIEHIAILPFDISTKNLMKTPVRGIQCIHPQCFDLQDYLSLLYISPNRQWKCPICNQEVKKFYIDNQVKKVLVDASKMIQQPKQIIFYPNGARILKHNQQQDQKLETNEKESKQKGEENPNENIEVKKIEKNKQE